MIVTLTPNPAVDKTLLVPSLLAGAVHRCREAHLDPGGKGINASRVVHRLGRPTVAITVLGGHIGKLLRDALAAEGVPCRSVPVREETRLNVIVQDEGSGASTRIWDRGATVPPDALADLDGLVSQWIPRAKVVACAGTLPPGVPDDWYARVIAEARRAGVPTLLDSDGVSFIRGLEGRPTVIKPNVREAEAALGRRLGDERAVIAGARELLDRGPEAVVVSMGASGSVLVTRDAAVRAVPPKVERRSAVGSGDSLVAGLLIAMHDGLPLADGLRLGTAAGAATAMTVGTQLGERAEIDELVAQVVVEAI